MSEDKKGDSRTQRRNRESTKRITIADTNLAESLVTHPINRLPEFLRGGVFNVVCMGTFASIYDSARNVGLDLPKDYIYGSDLVERLETVYSTNAPMKYKLGSAESKRLSMKEKQAETLESRIDKIVKAREVLDLNTTYINYTMLDELIETARRGTVPEHFAFQRLLFKVAYCREDSDVERMLLSFYNRITMLV